MCTPGDDWLTVAWLRRPWGRHGAVIAELHTDWPEERLAPGRLLTLEWPHGGERDERRLTAVRFTAQGAIVSIEGFEGISEARRLRGVRVIARRSELVDLGDDLHREDLVGLELVDADGAVRGQVVAIEEGVAADLLLVATNAGDEVLVPLAPQICTEIDLEARRILIDPPEGLLEPERAETLEPGGEE